MHTDYEPGLAGPDRLAEGKDIATPLRKIPGYRTVG